MPGIHSSRAGPHDLLDAPSRKRDLRHADCYIPEGDGDSALKVLDELEHRLTRLSHRRLVARSGLQRRHGLVQCPPT